MISSDGVHWNCAAFGRFQELLLAQQAQIQLYLEVLDKQRDAIEQGSAEDIVSYVELEEKITADILAIRKAVDPLEKTCQTAAISKHSETSALVAEILETKTVLEVLQREAQIRMKRNRELLFKRMTLLSSDIRVMKGSPLGNRTSLYSNTGIPSFLDLEL